MKVILITLLLVASAFSAAVQQKTMGAGPACPIDDPLISEAGALNVTLGDLLVLDIGSAHTGFVVTGLATLYYEYTINLFLLTATFKAGVSAEIKGDAYIATGSIDISPFSEELFPKGDIEGEGSFEGKIVGGYVEGSATILVNFITNRISLSRLELSVVTFDSIYVKISGFLVNGVAWDWDSWNLVAKELFHAEFVISGEALVERVRGVLNGFLGEYTLAEFLEIIGETGTAAPCDATTPAIKF